MHNNYRQLGVHKDRENQELKIDLYIILVDFGSFWCFINVRFTIQTLLDKKLFIYLMLNLGPFTHLMPVGIHLGLSEDR